VNTIGTVVVAAFAASDAAVPPPAVAAITATPRPTRFGGERGQLIGLAQTPAKFDRHVSPLGIACVLQAMPERGDEVRG
jgi:hypothetical protein